MEQEKLMELFDCLDQIDREILSLQEKRNELQIKIMNDFGFETFEEFKKEEKKKSEKKESAYTILEKKYYPEFQIASPASRSGMIETLKEYGIEDEQKAKKIISNFITKTRWDIRNKKNGFTFEPKNTKLKRNGDMYFIQLFND